MCLELRTTMVNEINTDPDIAELTLSRVERYLKNRLKINGKV